MKLYSRILGSSNEQAAALVLAQRPELLDERDPYGCTILHWAAKTGFAKISAQLLAQRPELANVLNRGKWTALHYAALEGHEAIVAQLLPHTSRNASLKVLDCVLEKGHDNNIVGQLLDHCPELIEAMTFHERSGFFQAASCGHHKAVAQVLARRPKLDASNCAPPLIEAAHEGHDKVVALLLDYNPLLADATKKDGSTALHEAAAMGRENIVAQLLACSPKLINAVTSDGNTVLHSALYLGVRKVLEQLLACKPALIDAVNSKGQTPLHSACSYSSLIAVEVLLAAKPEQALRVDRQGSTLLHLLLNRFQIFGKEIIDRVWRLNPAAVRVANHKGFTPLHVAAVAVHNSEESLLCECFWEFSVDEIASACATIRSLVGAPRATLEQARPLIDKHCESPLVGVLGRDVTSLVYLYLGLFQDQVERRNNKRKCDQLPYVLALC